MVSLNVSQSGADHDPALLQCRLAAVFPKLTLLGPLTIIEPEYEKEEKITFQ